MIQSSLFLLLYDEQGGAVGGRSILGRGGGGIFDICCRTGRKSRRKLEEKGFLILFGKGGGEGREEEERELAVLVPAVNYDVIEKQAEMDAYCSSSSVLCVCDPLPLLLPKSSVTPSPSSFPSQKTSK